MGGHHRGHKLIKAVAGRGWKIGKTAVKRGHKFLAMGDYAQLGGDLTGHEGLYGDLTLYP